jgi:hypothetical protein
MRSTAAAASRGEQRRSDADEDSVHGPDAAPDNWACIGYGKDL